MEQSESGVNRSTTEGKINTLLVRDGPMLLRWAWHLTIHSAEKGKRNWMNANTNEDFERFLESADRHFSQWVNGYDDEDHAAAVFFNMNGVEFVKSLYSGANQESSGGD